MENYFPFKTFILEPIFSVLYFPVWWYSRGLIGVFIFLRRKIRQASQNLALKILFRYLFKPMYGDYSREGRIISFFMRTIHLGWRLLKFLLVFIFSLTSFIFYLIIPLLTLYEIICHLGNFCFYFFLPSVI